MANLPVVSANAGLSYRFPIWSDSLFYPRNSIILFDLRDALGAGISDSDSDLVVTLTNSGDDAAFFMFIANEDINPGSGSPFSLGSWDPIPGALRQFIDIAASVSSVDDVEETLESGAYSITGGRRGKSILVKALKEGNGVSFVDSDGYITISSLNAELDSDLNAAIERIETLETSLGDSDSVVATLVKNTLSNLDSDRIAETVLKITVENLDSDAIMETVNKQTFYSYDSDDVVATINKQTLSNLDSDAIMLTVDKQTFYSYDSDDVVATIEKQTLTNLDSDTIVGSAKVAIDSEYIKEIVNGDYVRSHTIDSDTVLGLIDSDYVQSLVDSEFVIGIIDSDFLASAVSGPLSIRLDSEATRIAAINIRIDSEIELLEERDSELTAYFRNQHAPRFEQLSDIDVEYGTSISNATTPAADNLGVTGVVGFLHEGQNRLFLSLDSGHSFGVGERLYFDSDSNEHGDIISLNTIPAGLTVAYAEIQLNPAATTYLQGLISEYAGFNYGVITQSSLPVVYDKVVEDWNYFQRVGGVWSNVEYLTLDSDQTHANAVVRKSYVDNADSDLRKHILTQTEKTVAQLRDVNIHTPVEASPTLQTLFSSNTTNISFDSYFKYLTIAFSGVSSGDATSILQNVIEGHRYGFSTTSSALNPDVEVFVNRIYGFGRNNSAVGEGEIIFNLVDDSDGVEAVLRNLASVINQFTYADISSTIFNTVFVLSDITENFLLEYDISTEQFVSINKSELGSVDSDWVIRTAQEYGKVDSDYVLSVSNPQVDSDWVLSRLAELDSDEINALIVSRIENLADSDFIVMYVDEQIGDIPLDSDWVLRAIDSDKALLRSEILDSDQVKAIIDSDYLFNFITNIVDSEYTQSRVLDSDDIVSIAQAAVDSDYIQSLVDSDYVLSIVDSEFLTAVVTDPLRTEFDEQFDSEANRIFIIQNRLDSDETKLQSLQTQIDNDQVDSDWVLRTIDERNDSDINLLRGEILDSDNVKAIIDSDYILTSVNKNTFGSDGLDSETIFNTMIILADQANPPYDSDGGAPSVDDFDGRLFFGVYS